MAHHVSHLEASVPRLPARDHAFDLDSLDARLRVLRERAGGHSREARRTVLPSMRTSAAGRAEVVSRRDPSYGSHLCEGRRRSRLCAASGERIGTWVLQVWPRRVSAPSRLVQTRGRSFGEVVSRFRQCLENPRQRPIFLYASRCALASQRIQPKVTDTQGLNRRSEVSCLVSEPSR